MSAEELPDFIDTGALSRTGDTSATDGRPQQLTPVSVSRDGTRLTLVDADGHEFILTLGAGPDGGLRTTLPGGAGGTSRRSEKLMSTPTSGPGLRPKEIQARIRAGETSEAVADAAGTTVEKIMPFAGPVIGERQHMAERAQKASVRRAPGAPAAANQPAARVLGDAVAAQLDALGLEPDAVEWDSWRRHDGRWAIVGVFTTPVHSGTAELTFDPPGNFVSLDNDEARWLVGDLVLKAPEALHDDLAEVRERHLSPAPTLFEDDALGQDTLPLVDEPVEMFLEPGVEVPRPADGESAEAVTAQTSQSEEPVADPRSEREALPPRRTVSKKRGRASVPSWDEIMFGGSSDPACPADPAGLAQSSLVAELRFYTGPMDSGKSTLALQTNHNYASRGLAGRVFTAHDRAGQATVSSRLGLTHAALEVDREFDFWRYTVESLTRGGRIDFFICDEAQFYTSAQIDQLAKIVDELQINVYCFGILTDFRTKLFEGSARLVELADSTQLLQVEALCWCGKRATHQARIEDGVMVTEGEVIVVGDTDDSADDRVPGFDAPSVVAYEVLCRQHHRRQLTAARAKAVSLSAEPLPFD